MNSSGDRPVDATASFTGSVKPFVRDASRTGWVFFCLFVWIYMSYLHKDVLHNLIAVIVHAYVTGEGLAEENVSVKHQDVKSLIINSTGRFSTVSLPKVDSIPKVLR